MKTNDDKNLEHFVDGLMKQTSLDSPSPEFTSTLMMQVQVTRMDTVTVYKPLISKWGWFSITATVLLLLGYLFMNGDSTAEGWLNNSQFNLNAGSFLNNLAVVRFSAVTYYAIILATLLLFVQLIVLKHYFNKRIG